MLNTCDHSHVGNYAVVVYQDNANCPVCDNDEHLEHDISDELSRAIDKVIEKIQAVVDSKAGELWAGDDIKELDEAKEELEWAIR